jgi:hypothetical protein
MRPVASCAQEAAAKRVINAKLISKLRFANEKQFMKSDPFTHQSRLKCLKGYRKAPATPDILE